MLIGLTGKARSGKDTFAVMLADALFGKTGRRFTLAAFAQELKLRVQKDFDLDYEQLWGEDKEAPDRRYCKCLGVEGNPESFWSGREILQSYGQFYRTIDSSFWVRNLLMSMQEKEVDNVIITDVRHTNEADSVLDNDGYIVKITSDRSDKQCVHGTDHVSEVDMDSYGRIDFTVVNDLGLPELSQVAKDVVSFLIDSENKKENLEESKNG